MESLKVIYICDENLINECNRLPTMLNRASMVQDLIDSYGLLLSDNITIVESERASEDDLKDFHSTNYVNFMKNTNLSDDLELYEEEQLEFGLGYDCPLLERNYDLISCIAGGTLTAANLLCKHVCDVAINWFGGWHHAQRDEAEGFCYVNDIVLGIQKLQKEFGKVLYVDLDVHHGNGVQNAFELSAKVLTLSFHKNVPGFYPGSGLLDEIGNLKGKYHSINVPFLDGINDETYHKMFSHVFQRIYEAFKPSAIVVQCGADILVGDPIGECNVTLETMGKCFQQILNYEKPCLVLGGGGYNFANTARYWTYLTSIVLNKSLDEDIPDHCQYFTCYEPTYELSIDAGNQKDYNAPNYIAYVLNTIEKYCEHISKGL